MRNRARRPQPKMMHAGRYVRPWSIAAVSKEIEPLVQGYRDALGLIENIPSRLEAIAADKELSDVGKATRRRALAQENAQVVKRARDAMAAGIAQIETLRSDMLRTSIDKTDLASAVLRSEIRTWLRGLPDARRTALLISGADPQITSAVIEAPAELSGVTPDRHDQMREDLIRQLNPESVQKADQIAEALASLASAEKVAYETLTKGSGIAPHELNELMGDASLVERIRARLDAAGFDISEANDDDAEDAVQAA